MAKADFEIVWTSFDGAENTETFRTLKEAATRYWYLVDKVIGVPANATFYKRQEVTPRRQ